MKLVIIPDYYHAYKNIMETSNNYIIVAFRFKLENVPY